MVIRDHGIFEILGICNFWSTFRNFYSIIWPNLLNLYYFKASISYRIKISKFRKPFFDLSNNNIEILKKFKIQNFSTNIISKFFVSKCWNYKISISKFFLRNFQNACPIISGLFFRYRFCKSKCQYGVRKEFLINILDCA